MYENEIFAVHSGLPVPQLPTATSSACRQCQDHSKETQTEDRPSGESDSIPFLSFLRHLFFTPDEVSCRVSSRNAARLLGQLTCGQCQAQQVAGKQAGVSLAASCAAIFVAIVDWSAALSEPWEGASGAEERGVEGLG